MTAFGLPETQNLRELRFRAKALGYKLLRRGFEYSLKRADGWMLERSNVLKDIIDFIEREEEISRGEHQTGEVKKIEDKPRVKDEKPALEPQTKAVARPLPELSKLIAKDLEEGDAAAKQAGMPFYQAAGEKLIEAKTQLKHGEFTSWIKRNFKISERTARYYMGLAKESAKQNGSALPFSSLGEFIRKTKKRNASASPAGPQPESIEKLKADDKSLAISELGLRLIKIGYRELPKEMHPDSGGNDEQMTMLNHAHKQLKEFCRLNIRAAAL